MKINARALQPRTMGVCTTVLGTAPNISAKYAMTAYGYDKILPYGSLGPRNLHLAM